MHSGKSTGARTPEGLARLAAANTKHGNHSAAWRALNHYQRAVIERSRVLADAYLVGPYLPPDIAARMKLGAHELAPPPHFSLELALSSGTSAATGCDPWGRGLACDDPAAGQGSRRRDAHGRFVARARPALCGRRGEREGARLEAAMLAPWRAGIAWARALERAVLKAARRHKAMLSLRPGACPGGGTVRPGGAAARAGSVAGQGVEDRDVGRHPMQREMVGQVVVPARMGSVLGALEFAEYGWHLIQREVVRPVAGHFAGGVGSWAGGGARRPRTTPHATGGGRAG